MIRAFDIIIVISSSVFSWVGWTLILSFEFLNIIFGIISIVFASLPFLIGKQKKEKNEN